MNMGTRALMLLTRIERYMTVEGTIHSCHYRTPNVPLVSPSTATSLVGRGGEEPRAKRMRLLKHFVKGSGGVSHKSRYAICDMQS